LIEVLVALSALVLVGTTAVTVIVSSYENTALSREYLVAQNLAREGLEGVTNIRDTNWLLYPAEMGQCWLVIDSGSCPPADGKEPNNIGRYIVDRHDDGQYSMKYRGQDEHSVLDLVGDPANSASYRLWKYDGVYQHTSSSAEETIWYRMITLEEVDADTSLSEQVKVTVLIQWDKEPGFGQYEISTILTNYAK